MLLFARYFLYLLPLSTTVNGFDKCCPSGEVAQKIPRHLKSDKVFEENIFHCKKIPMKTQSGTTNTSLAGKHDLSQLVSHNFVVDNNSHWPSCYRSEISSYELENSVTTSRDSTDCVDIMDGNYFLFTCSTPSPRVTEKIYKMRKCCDENFSYNVLYRKCIADEENSTDIFDEIFQNQNIVFEFGLPDCTKSEALIDYHSSLQKIEFLNGSLRVNREEVPVPLESFCVEKTSNATYEDWELEEFKLKVSSKYIVKVCRSDKICNQIPCVRKCCKEGQRINNETKQCENNASHLEMSFITSNISHGGTELIPFEPEGQLGSSIN